MSEHSINVSRYLLNIQSKILYSQCSCISVKLAKILISNCLIGRSNYTLKKSKLKLVMSFEILESNMFEIFRFACKKFGLKIAEK